MIRIAEWCDENNFSEYGKRRIVMLRELVKGDIPKLSILG